METKELTLREAYRMVKIGEECPECSDTQVHYTKFRIRGGAQIIVTCSFCDYMHGEASSG